MLCRRRYVTFADSMGSLHYGNVVRGRWLVTDLPGWASMSVEGYERGSFLLDNYSSPQRPPGGRAEAVQRGPAP